MKKNLKVLLWIFKHGKPVLPFIILTSILGGILSGIGVYSALISKSLIDAATSGNMNLVLKWLIIMAAIYFIRLGLNIVNSLTSTYSSTQLFNQIQKKMYVTVTYSEWMAQSKYHSVNLLTRITSDVGTVSSVILSSLNSIVSLSVTLITSFIALLYLDPGIAIFTVTITPIYLIFSKMYSRRLKTIYKEVQDQDIVYRSFIQESIQNLMIVKTFCHEEENFETLNQHHKKKLQLSLKSTRFGLYSSIIFGTISFFIYFAIYGFSAIKLTTGALTFGSMTALLQLYGKVSGPLSSFAGIGKQFIHGIAAAERLIEIENLPTERVNTELKTLKIEKPIIEFENVSFDYNKKQSILKDITFKITPGETVALVGPSGQGKTTIIRLILSLINANKGKLMIQKQKISREHRQLISYVPQGNTLFSGSIRENIAFGTPNATDHEIIEAAKQAYAWDFIEQLDEKLDTRVGEKGLGLSEGQAQRIAIARAFLRKKPILILDEATSALDGQTEIDVLESVKNLPHQPTCIIITHRPSALEICDRVLRLESGHLQEELAG
ncbi:ABC transporter ATP-binding protein [Turicibacter sanguinis]|uniref:ABC transporter ATP-binding protein n=1 Tax=Turicibacter sanguinis TaxID=154288 RepID=UPI0018ABE8E4|nr:ABC transporter ATP-binding protein [Turicibacter sanguinis]MDB8558250.1 ABC transporter ATP-binding protein [Turicibacter sanguinis]MDB8561026.1 ABC transporter ATP-binding protein [Turicibacter sanguinis]